MHWLIMETLCAYIRENAGRPRPLPSEAIAILTKSPLKRYLREDRAFSESLRVIGSPTVDVQAAISVIGRRGLQQRENERGRLKDRGSGSSDDWRLDLTSCQLASAIFAGLDFRAARFSGSALYGADFRNTRLEDAQLREAHLEGALLWEVHLEGALLKEAHLAGARLHRAHLEGANLVEAHLEGTVLLDASS